MGLHSPLHPDLFIPVTMRACTHAYDKYITFTRIHTHIYVYIFSNRQFLSTRKEKKGGRGGKRGKKMEKWATKGGKFFWKVLYLVGSFSTLHRPVHSRLLTRRSLPLTRGYRFSKRGVTPVGSSALRGSLHASKRPVWKKSKVCVDIVLRVAGISHFTVAATLNFEIRFVKIYLSREKNFFFFISFEIANNLVPSFSSTISLISSNNTN